MSSEVGRTHVVDVEAGATVPPEGHFLYARDTDKVYKSDGTTLTELASGGGGGLDAEGAQDAVGAMVDTTLVYTDATPLLSRAALTGDVTASAGSNATTIANDAVTYAKIQNVTDARLLGRSAGSSGDVQEITVGSSLDLSSGNLALPSWMNKYNPDRPPSSLGTGGISDEFIGGTTLTFSGQNLESSTFTAVHDGVALFHPTDSTGVAVWWVTGPDGSSTDWSMHIKFSMQGSSTSNYFGINLLATGTEATPTLMYSNVVYTSTTSSVTWPKAGFRSLTSYTSATGTIGSDIPSAQTGYLSLGYVKSTKVLTAYYSPDGMNYRAYSTQTLAAHPTTSFGLALSSLSSSTPGHAFVHWLRIRTDANMLDAGS